MPGFESGDWTIGSDSSLMVGMGRECRWGGGTGEYRQSN